MHFTSCKQVFKENKRDIYKFRKSTAVVLVEPISFLTFWCIFICQEISVVLDRCGLRERIFFTPNKKNKLQSLLVQKGFRVVLEIDEAESSFLEEITYTIQQTSHLCLNVCCKLTGFVWNRATRVHKQHCYKSQRIFLLVGLSMDCVKKKHSSCEDSLIVKEISARPSNLSLLNHIIMMPPSFCGYTCWSSMALYSMSWNYRIVEGGRAIWRTQAQLHCSQQNQLGCPKLFLTQIRIFFIPQSLPGQSVSVFDHTYSKNVFCSHLSWIFSDSSRCHLLLCWNISWSLYIQCSWLCHPYMITHQQDVVL